MLVLLAVWLFAVTVVGAGDIRIPDRWSDDQDIAHRLADLASDHDRVSVRSLGRSTGERDLLLATIDPVGSDTDDPSGPAILVVGDPLGTVASGRGGPPWP